MKRNNVRQILLIGNLLLGMLIIMGCEPCKRLQKLCPAKDSLIYVEKIKLDTVLFYLPGDTTIFEIPVDFTDYALIEENAKQKVQLNILKGKLRLVTICKDDSLKMVIANLEKSKQEIKTVYVDKDKIVFKTRPIFLYSFFILLGLIIISITVVYVKYKTAILGVFRK